MQAPAAMFTASHNPAAYNGIKFSRAGAQGISLDTGLAAIRDRAADYLEQGIPAAATPGAVTSSATCSPTTPRTCARSST